MGGEGAMMQANQSIKYNKSLIERRKKDKDKTGIYSHIKVEFPKSRPEEVLRVRKAMLEQNRNRFIKRLALFIVITIITFKILTLILV